MISYSEVCQFLISCFHGKEDKYKRCLELIPIIRIEKLHCRTVQCVTDTMGKLLSTSRVTAPSFILILFIRCTHFITSWF